MLSKMRGISRRYLRQDGRGCSKKRKGTVVLGCSGNGLPFGFVQQVQQALAGGEMNGCARFSALSVISNQSSVTRNQ
jgi:hypothetical protein